MVAFVRLAFVWCLVWARQASPPCPARKFPHRREISGGAGLPKTFVKAGLLRIVYEFAARPSLGPPGVFPALPPPQQGERVVLIVKVGPPPAGASTPWRPLPASLRSARPRSSVNCLFVRLLRLFVRCKPARGPTQAEDRPVQGGRGRARFVPLGPGFVCFWLSCLSGACAARPPSPSVWAAACLGRGADRAGICARPLPPLARASSSRPSPLPSRKGNDGGFFVKRVVFWLCSLRFGGLRRGPLSLFFPRVRALVCCPSLLSPVCWILRALRRGKIALPRQSVTFR